MISFPANRPAIQFGSCQVVDYDTVWLEEAIHQAAEMAQAGEFSVHREIRQGIDLYLEQRCPLRVLHLEHLFDKIRRMLEQIGCDHIAANLAVTAPPITVSLIDKARDAGNGFELAFFEALRIDLRELKCSGARMIHFTGLRESVAILRGKKRWSKDCELLSQEIHSFVGSPHTPEG